MKLAAILIALSLFFFKESYQQTPSVTCTSDTPSFGTFSTYSSTLYSRGRQKCTFANINSFESMKRVITTSPYTAQNIVSIAFNDSSISEFPAKAFTTFTSLRVLDASNLNLITIDPTALTGIAELDFVNLSFNNLTSLPAKLFANIKLKLLDLSNNLISEIEDTTFTGSEIDKINLSFNKLKSMRFANGLKNFVLLQLNDNLIERVDKFEFSGWSGKQPIFLAFQFPSINLQNNLLKTFDCASTVKFTLFDLENNRDLSEVRLNDCEINQFDVTNCVNLRKIQLNDRVSGLTAKNVQFEAIDFSASKSLMSLTLVNNSLSTQMLESITKIENLTMLDLSYNHIGPLNISTFAKLKALTSLKLKKTGISDITFGTFSHQTGVRVLDLSDNSFGYFDMQMIFAMNSLVSLDLSGNELTELKNIESAHTTFAALERIDLSNNQWTCKYLMRLVRIMKAYRVQLVQSKVEEHKSNIQGIFCVHVEGDDSVIVPLLPDIQNITEVREKVNEVLAEVSKASTDNRRIEQRLSALERRVDERMTSFAASALLSSSKVDKIEVKNGALLEVALVIVCCCFAVFVALKVVAFTKGNFMRQSRVLRGNSSQNTLTIDDDF